MYCTLPEYGTWRSLVSQFQTKHLQPPICHHRKHLPVRAKKTTRTYLYRGPHSKGNEGKLQVQRRRKTSESGKKERGYKEESVNSSGENLNIVCMSQEPPGNKAMLGHVASVRVWRAQAHTLAATCTCMQTRASWYRDIARAN